MRSRYDCGPDGRRPNALVRYFRARLRRRIFTAFVATIFFTLFAVGATVRVQDHGRPGSWSARVERVAIAAVVLWGASGLLARRLSRPIEELAFAAEQIGKGRPPSATGALDRAPREVRMVTHVMEEMAARIQKQLDDQRALLAAVSHEIRTPLSRMRLLVEMGRTRFGEDKGFDELDREVSDMDALVSDLLASSRMDFAALSPSDLSAERVARDAMEREGVDASVLAPVAPGLSLRGDANLVIRAVANLLSNARRHGGGALAVRVEGDAFGRAVAFEVDDGGPGIPSGDEERIFEPFARRGGEGSVGLGLSLVRRIAEAHGGRAYARTRPGGGATVGVTFERAPRTPS